METKLIDVHQLRERLPNLEHAREQLYREKQKLNEDYFEVMQKLREKYTESSNHNSKAAIKISAKMAQRELNYKNDYSIWRPFEPTCREDPAYRDHPYRKQCQNRSISLIEGQVECFPNPGKRTQKFWSFANAGADKIITFQISIEQAILLCNDSGNIMRLLKSGSYRDLPTGNGVEMEARLRGEFPEYHPCDRMLLPDGTYPEISDEVLRETSPGVGYIFVERYTHHEIRRPGYTQEILDLYDYLLYKL